MRPRWKPGDFCTDCRETMPCECVMGCFERYDDLPEPDSAADAAADRYHAHLFKTPSERRGAR